MNRIDRLTAILLLLQGGKRTAGELADRFEVSKRTILRDVQALCEIGIPIVTDLGVSGGYTLPEDYSLPALALTFHEALLLRLALSSVSQLAETPFKQERESLLAKIQTLLPRNENQHLERFEDTLSLNVPSRSYPTPFLEPLLQSAAEKQWLAVRYRSEKGVSEQTLLPIRVRTEAGLWYCEAYSYERQELRIYRVDRFLDARKAVTPSQDQAPESNILHVHPSYPEIHISLTARGVLRLEREPYLSTHVEQQPTGMGDLRLHLRPAEYDWLVQVLLSLGTDAKVIEPESLRLRVQREALEIADYYA